MATITWTDFERVELRVGTVLTAELNPKARKPAYVLTIDLGDAGIRTSSAQILDRYAPEDLIGRQVLCVCNFEPKRVAGVKSEVLVTGAHDKDGAVVLAGFEHPVPDGTRLL
ncbi:export-like chaperone protein CsaA [Frankia torreyi]|uniref:Export-like chaperone protein CsaA n=1 Tax=Frankia torreyi TaxID=1856 RepID=A0A0D8BAG1_9ACTN|nr:tRNA-binding protein [Frankia torreyi]KJE21100.1 export-like chaperone protein CsaA [Frankia torreyi]